MNKDILIKEEIDLLDYLIKEINEDGEYFIRDIPHKAISGLFRGSLSNLYDEGRKDPIPTTTMSSNIAIHIHESNGLSYLSYPPQKKCKTCGEFYRE